MFNLALVNEGAEQDHIGGLRDDLKREQVLFIQVKIKDLKFFKIFKILVL